MPNNSWSSHGWQEAVKRLLEVLGGNNVFKFSPHAHSFVLGIVVINNNVFMR
jgi:hypothetical protein